MIDTRFTASHKALFLLLIGVVLASSLFRLTESPSIWYDEGLYIQTARNIASSHTYGIQLDPQTFLSGQYMTVGFPLTYPLAFAFNTFGYGVEQARTVMVFFILGFALAGFALMRKLFGTRSALWSLALLSVFPPLYANGKSVLGEVPGLLYLTLALLFLYYARTNAALRLRFAMLAGLFVGLACVTKPVFLLLLPALAIGLFHQGREFIQDTKVLLWSAVAFTIPVLTWMATQFSHTDSLRTTLGFYANPYAVAETKLGSLVLGNLSHFFTDIGPLFLLGMMVVWTLAVIVRKRASEEVSLEEIIAYALCIISILAYLRTGGFYRYLFPYQAIALLFFPSALSRVVAYLRTQFSLSAPFFSKVPALVCAGLILMSGYQLLFDSWVADFYTSTKTAAWEAFFAGVPEDKSVFFYNTPEVAVFIRTENYYQYIAPYRNPAAVQWGVQELQVLAEGIPDIVVIETRLLDSAEPHLAHYAITDTNNKYTILERLSNSGTKSVR